MDFPRVTITKVDIEKVMQNIKARKEKVPIEIPMGFEYLDEMLGGLHKGQMVIIAGHPGIGITSFVISIVEKICLEKNIPVAFFTMQQSREQLLERLLFNYSRIDFFKARRGTLDNSECERIAQVGKLLTGKPLYIDDTARLTPIELRNRVDKISKEQGQSIQCIIVDNLQMMDTEIHHGTQRQRIAEVSENLKALACDLNVPVIVLCDLKLESILAEEGRRKPKINDLGENIIIERYADVIMLLHRDDYYCRGDSDYEPNNNAEVTVTRNNNGPTGIAAVQFLSDIARFEDVMFNGE